MAPHFLHPIYQDVDQDIKYKIKENYNARSTFVVMWDVLRRFVVYAKHYAFISKRLWYDASGINIQLNITV